MNSKLTYYIYLILGLLSLVLGAIGLFLPILPTTPFLLLASYFFLKSSKKMHDWLMRHRIFGNYIRNYLEHKAIKKSDRIKSLIFLWLTLIISMILSKNIHLILFLSLIGSAVSLHLMLLKTIKSSKL